MSDFKNSDHFEVIITTRPARKRTEGADPVFAMQAHITAGVGTSAELVYLSPCSERMGFTYIALSAYRFLAEEGIDITKTTITFSWKQHNDQAASA